MSVYVGPAVRVVAHYGIDDCDVERALDAFARVTP
jgi:hypothetical protein